MRAHAPKVQNVLPVIIISFVFYLPHLFVHPFLFFLEGMDPSPIIQCAAPVTNFKMKSNYLISHNSLIYFKAPLGARMFCKCTLIRVITNQFLNIVFGKLQLFVRKCPVSLKLVIYLDYCSHTHWEKTSPAVTPVTSNCEK